MRKHNAFWHTCSSTCVNQSTTVSRPYFFHSLLKVSKFNPMPFNHESIPMINYFFIFWCYFTFGIVINYEQFNNSFIYQSKIFLCKLKSLSNYDSTLRMVSNIFTWPDCISRVYSSWKASCKNTSEKCYAPLWRVESNNVNWSILFYPESY